GWGDVEGLGIEFYSSCVGVLGDGNDIRNKSSNIKEKGAWVDGEWVWVWDWVLDIRGRMGIELDELVGMLQNVVISNNCRARWRWRIFEDDIFTTKELSSLIEDRILLIKGNCQEMLCNKLVPKKVNIFVWRALKGRLPVRVELDRRGIDLDSVLCPSCNNATESCAHSLVTCDLAMSVWKKIYSWWKLGAVNAFTIGEFFASGGNVNTPKNLSRAWQAVIWSTGYFIWKERNARVFGQNFPVQSAIFGFCKQFIVSVMFSYIQ
ncbi:RNA-directed DNA polymerase, eukaryota, reverse transcriptase zinc-binding domain protein, partial [Tanacetum coccineum]